MSTKIIMDSGKEYIIKESIDHVLEALFGENKLSMSSVKILKNTFLKIDQEKEVFINPVHVSSVEAIIE
ncbi:hypothetical protein [Bacillus massiliglaciei]|uniref:hypothetical protein n=1 Tax=Bacillus massiliglaciei TaxID=1816693 RepID=UPI000DA63EAD|nr:hypothetical protein [Bacillus massiliglaciei]